MTKTRKRTVIVNRRKFFTFVTLLIVMMNIFFLCTWMPDTTQADTVYKTQTVTVSNGDTLWSIAQDYCSADDVRNTVYQIKEMNGLSTTELFVGQEILVPIN